MNQRGFDEISNIVVEPSKLDVDLQQNVGNKLWRLLLLGEVRRNHALGQSTKLGLENILDLSCQESKRSPTSKSLILAKKP